MEVVCSLLSLVFLLYLIYMSVHVIVIVYGLCHLHSYKDASATSKEDDKDLPGVSVIKPIVHADPNLKTNLESFFKLNYPKFELMFCIGETKDQSPPSLSIVNELVSMYPEVKVKIFVGASVVGINPKINNIFQAYNSTEYDILWLSDSNIMTTPNTLREMARRVIHPRVALVHQLPYVAAVESFADCLDKVYFGTQHSRVYLWANLIGENCANGMSWVVKKTALDAEGGITVFSDYLAEDFFMGKALWNRGWKFSLSSLPALQNPGSRSISAFQSRIIRWGRLRASMMPFPGLLEPLTESVVLGVVGCLVTYYLLGVNPGLFFICHFAFWFLCDMLLLRIIENNSPSFHWKLVLMWLFREVWTLPLYIFSIYSREVYWGGSRFKLQHGGKATKLD